MRKSHIQLRRSKNSLANKLCRCIKKVRKTIKSLEKNAIGICVTSVLQTRGKTLKKFKCKPPYLITQTLRT